MKYNTPLLLLLLLALSACNLEGTHTKKTQSTGIIGQWQWVETTGGFAGITDKPDVLGYPMVIMNFSSSNRYSVVRNDTLVRTGTFTLSKQNNKEILKMTPSDTSFSYNPTEEVTYKGNDTLILMDRCYDCFITTYIRIN
ncbi:MAG TPA: hypothetical protein VKA34_16515 [Balneolales bacterium]|nr:hypothetical protein [Balneolales bacterium]